MMIAREMKMKMNLLSGIQLLCTEYLDFRSLIFVEVIKVKDAIVIL